MPECVRTVSKDFQYFRDDFCLKLSRVPGPVAEVSKLVRGYRCPSGVRSTFRNERILPGRLGSESGLDPGTRAWHLPSSDADGRGGPIAGHQAIHEERSSATHVAAKIQGMSIGPQLPIHSVSRVP